MTFLRNKKSQVERVDTFKDTVCLVFVRYTSMDFFPHHIPTMLYISACFAAGTTLLINLQHLTL